MSPIVRRARGLLLRLIRRRRLTILLGIALAAPAGVVQLSGGSDAWWAEGLSLVAVATGMALIWTGVAGARPDWIDGAP